MILGLGLHLTKENFDLKLTSFVKPAFVHILSRLGLRAVENLLKIQLQIRRDFIPELIQCE